MFFREKYTKKFELKDNSGLLQRGTLFSTYVCGVNAKQHFDSDIVLRRLKI